MHDFEQPESGLMALLDRYGLVKLSGEDAVTFIHGQLSHDIAGLKADSARFAGYCTPEGRLLAIMLVWKSGGDVWMMLPREIVPALVKRLQVYVLRSKVSITDMSGAFTVHGLAGEKAEKAMTSALFTLPDGEQGKTEGAFGTLIRIRDVSGSVRFLWVAPADEAVSPASSLALSLDAGSDEDWEAGDIAAGMPQVYLATQNRFVPQMLNMEAVDALSFTKGCYPGQEVVARLQYRGRVKRRMIPAYAGIAGETPAADAGVVPGMDVFDPASPGEPCGTVIRAARCDSNRIACLMTVSQEGFSLSSLRLGAPDGPALYAAPLPYSLPDEAGED